jgi:hypothetical protein
VYEQIHNVQGQVFSLAGEFSASAVTQAKHEELGRLLVQLIAERTALEAEVEQARALLHSPLVNFVTSSGAAK